MYEREIRNALFPIGCEWDAKPLWEVYPPYSIAPDFNDSAELVATLKGCYAPEAVRLRAMFLGEVDRLTKEAVEGSGWGSIANDLYAIAGAAFGAHLRTRELWELRLFHTDGITLQRLCAAFFRPMEELSDRSQTTMRAALSSVWDWARRWGLDHYTYVHFACVALIGAHRYVILEGFPMNAPAGPMWAPAPDKRQADDFFYRIEPAWGWSGAWQAYLVSALGALHGAVPPAPKGFYLYHGATSYKDAGEKPDVRRTNYAARRQRDAREAIENSLLSNLSEATKGRIIAEIGEIAREHAEFVDSFFNKRKKIAPGRWGRFYRNDIEWTIARVIFRRNWDDIVKEGKAQQDKVEKAVRRTIEKIHIPKDSAFFGKPGRRRIGKSDV